MKNIPVFLFIAFSFLHINMMAQKCGSSLNMQLIQQENPVLYNKLLQIENHTKTFIKNESLKSMTSTNNIIRIPVVVHVLYHTSNENISDAQIFSQIEVLNEDFRRRNADNSNTPSVFLSIASDPEIEFFLACIDPNGNTTNGITRTYTDSVQFTQILNPDNTTNEISTGIKYTSLGGHDAWPSDRYLNIWTCNLSGTLLGYAQFPGIGQATTDGVVIKYNCFGRIGVLDPIYNMGRTTTHEIGHWLNLIHIWGDDDNANEICTSNECSGNDNVADTPNQGERSSGCPSFPQTDCCTPASPGVMFMNFMDYTDDVCMNLFTAGQKNRMRALFFLDGFRECFVTNPIIDVWCNSLASYSGPSVVCSSGAQFTISNLPPVDSIIWSCGPYLTVYSGQNTNSSIIKATSNGNSWVQARLVNACGSINLPRKEIWAGTPTPEAIDIINIGPYYPGGNQICTNRPNDGIINWNPLGGILEYDWQAGNWQVVQHPMDPFPDIPKQNVQLTAPYYGYDNPVSFTVRARNQCGWGNYLAPAIILNGVSCGGYYLVASPNPAGSYIELTLIPEADVSEVAGKTKIEQTGSNNGFGNYQIQLWSEQGGLLKTVQSDQLKLNLSVRDLPEGKYYLHLLKDGNIYKHQLLIQR